jgi:hypothetical protein
MRGGARAHAQGVELRADACNTARLWSATRHIACESGHSQRDHLCRRPH